MPDLAQQSSLRLPAVKHDARGQRRVDLRMVISLALPLFVNSGIQALLNLTDTWFIGRISTDATAAVGASYWFVIVAILFFGGPGLADLYVTSAAYRLSPGQLKRQPHAGATFVCRPGAVGMPAPSFAG